MARELLFYPNKILTTPCKKVEIFDENLRKLADNMTSLMYQLEGNGLAAPQVGENIQLFVAELGASHLLVAVNPTLELEGEMRTTLEGCLSLPSIEARLKCRHSQVTLTAQDLEGREFIQTLIVRDAVVVQHEVDHLAGITLFQRMDPVQRRLSLKKYLKQRK